MPACLSCDSPNRAEAVFCSTCGAATGPDEPSVAPVKKGKPRKRLLFGAVLAVVVLGGGTALAIVDGGRGDGSSDYETCWADPSTTADECNRLQVSTGGSSDTEGVEDLPSDEGYSDTEGYYEQPTYVQPQPTYQPPQPKTCLEWRTNYRYQPPPIHQFGQSPGAGSQVPTGQTCVRYG